MQIAIRVINIPKAKRRRAAQGAPHWDIVSLERTHEGVELDAELDVAVADVLGRGLCTAPAMEGCFDGFHVPNEVVYDHWDVGVKLVGLEHAGVGSDRGTHAWRVLSERRVRSWTSRGHGDV